MDTAYEIFDKKYTMDQISVMPYKILLERLERESKNYDKKAEARANERLAKEIGM